MLTINETKYIIYTGTKIQYKEVSRIIQFKNIIQYCLSFRV